MSNPTFKSGPITFDAAEDLVKFRLVTVTENGASHAEAAGPVFGAVTTGAKANPPQYTDDNVLHIGKPGNVAVHITPSVVPVEVDGDETAIKKGAPVFAAADGKASATGTVFVGTAVRDGAAGTVKVLLAGPTAPAAPAGE
ncbi:hypothetical protein [Corynebacterium kalidii]